MKACLGQINTTPGDFAGNFARIKQGVETAADAGCSLIVFPELSIPGYLSQDLLYNAGFIDRNLETLDQVISLSRDHPELHMVAGYIGRNDDAGKPFTNLAGVVHGGELLCEYQKQLLPFYDVFDELRYFEPGRSVCTFELCGRQVGIAICEDLWNDKSADDYNYKDNPLEQYRRAGVDLLISLNSSPFVHGKRKQRLEQIVPATESGLTVIYVNQTGGQDELVFDGQSFVARHGRVHFLSSVVHEDSFPVVDLDSLAEGDSIAQAVAQGPALKDMLVLGLRDYVVKSGFDQVVLASSGGVDSAVVCMLACDALGPEKVHAIRMPSAFSSTHSRDDAKALHESLGCHDYEMPVRHEQMVEELKAHFALHPRQGYDQIADENIQARLRDLYLMHFSNAYGVMPLATGNKTESGCGYYTHFDMNFSYAPIKDLYKFQVIDLARNDRRIPEHIWQKPPSAELAPGQTDEASLLPYAILDPVVMAYIEDYVTSFERFREWVSAMPAASISGDASRLTDWLGRKDAEAEYRRIVSLIGKMEYKRRQTCPGTKVSRVAFGTGRRIPIVEKWS